LALLVRLLYLQQASSAPAFDLLIVDARQYSKWAHAIASGDWLGSEVFYQAPLYPYLMALIELVAGPGPAPIRVVQCVFGALSCGFLFLVGREFFSHRVGLIAGALLALYPPAIFFDSLVQKASLGGLLVIAVLWCAGRARQAASVPRLVGLGLAQGLLMLTREETLLLAPILAAWIAWRASAAGRAAQLRQLAALVFGAALVLTPVAARNYAVGGEFALTTSQAGTNFFIGNNSNAKGIYAPLRPGRSDTAYERVDAIELAELAAGRKLSPAEVSAHWFAQAWSWIGSAPGAWLRLLWMKFCLALNAYEVADAEDLYYFAEHSSLLAVLLAVLHMGVVVPLAAAGVVLAWDKRRQWGLLLVLGCVLLAGVVAFYVMARYRYPLVPLALLFAAAALDAAPKLVAERRWRALAPAAAALALFGVLANWTLAHRPTGLAAAHHNVASALESAGRRPEAELEYRRALELNARVPETCSRLALLLDQRGERVQALALHRRALELRPDDPRLLQRLGAALAARGEFAQSEPVLVRSTELFAGDPEAWTALRDVRIAAGRWVEAAQAARAGVAANPQDESLRVSLAWMLAAAPDEKVRAPAESLALAEELLRSPGAPRFEFHDLHSLALEACGRRDEALAAALRAADLAGAAGQKEIQAAIEERVRSWRADAGAQR
jgi:4-amino-4-deoxy-L-arabinose transferase-like glycosyltransferase